MKITIYTENAQAAYDAADDKGKEMLEKLFGSAFTPEDKRPITEKIKTFEDACKAVGTPKIPEGLPKGIVAHMKLCTITEALNEGWKPIFDGETYRYFPRFELLDKAAYDEALAEGEVVRFFAAGGSANFGTVCGFGCVHSNYAWSCATSLFGSRLVLKSSDLAIYCGKQFIDLWGDLIFG